MTECELCYKPFEVGDNDGEHHNICADLWKERHGNGMCVYCGKESRKTIITEYCVGCESNREYGGYPGPQ